MEINNDDAEQPLLPPRPTTTTDDPSVEMSSLNKAMNQTFKCAADLANLLPTGTVMAFHLLSPILSNGGHCKSAYRAMTASLVALCGLSCFLLSFTDSFYDKDGKVHYGFATLKGLWIIDGVCRPNSPVPDAEKYRLRVMDFVHALMSLLVFGAVTLFDQNTVACLYPLPSPRAREVLAVLPVVISVVCCSFFVAFPTTRRGIGFPLSPK
ncbi:hypothetical protein QJS04_geneDACA022458 [Acorus gramineus]|uniref:Uncharacterized protein n=1 Tax=Acorus gramineus TaxID=55184 RepID=A0AAV9BHM6_ACOGR|nr:hypothetical protein QJS04_geneDACA022458 [Acorus gramineus]